MCQELFFGRIYICTWNAPTIILIRKMFYARHEGRGRKKQGWGPKCHLPPFWIFGYATKERNQNLPTSMNMQWCSCREGQGGSTPQLVCQPSLPQFIWTDLLEGVGFQPPPPAKNWQLHHWLCFKNLQDEEIRSTMMLWYRHYERIILQIIQQ